MVFEPGRRRRNNADDVIGDVRRRPICELGFWLRAAARPPVDIGAPELNRCLPRQDVNRLDHIVGHLDHAFGSGLKRPHAKDREIGSPRITASVSSAASPIVTTPCKPRTDVSSPRRSCRTRAGRARRRAISAAASRMRHKFAGSSATARRAITRASGRAGARPPWRAPCVIDCPIGCDIHRGPRSDQTHRRLRVHHGVRRGLRARRNDRRRPSAWRHVGARRAWRSRR